MEGIVSGPGEGEPLGGDDRLLHVKAVSPELEFFEYDVGPTYPGAGPHFHERHADSFYVLEGELEFTVGGETIRAPAGTYVQVPPGVVHSFTNPGPVGARFLNIHAPKTGFADYLRAVARGERVDPKEFDIYDVD